MFTLGLSVVASLLFGLAPTRQASRVDLSEALKQGAARPVVGGRCGGLRGALVIAEVALSVVLLAGAGLLIRSFIALHNVALGFRPEHVLVMQSSVPASDLAGARRATRLYKDLLAELTFAVFWSRRGQCGLWLCGDGWKIQSRTQAGQFLRMTSQFASKKD